MSPLWSDLAIAHAAKAAATARGVIAPAERSDDTEAKRRRDRLQPVRRPVRRPLTSFAL